VVGEITKAQIEASLTSSGKYPTDVQITHSIKLIRKETESKNCVFAEEKKYLE